MAEILLQGATVVYNEGGSSEIAALANVNLFIEDADFLSIVGSNGSGKSTLLKVISGAVSLTSGKIWIDRKNVTTETTSQRAKAVSTVHQLSNDGVAMGMTVQDNLALAMLKDKRMSLRIPRSIRNEITSCIEPLGFHLFDKLDVPVRELSGGLRQLVALAMAVIQKPRILLLDEHTAPLDQLNREQINDLTLEITRAQRMTTIMVSHSAQDALQFGNRLIQLHEGEIVLDADRQHKSRLRAGDLRFD